MKGTLHGLKALVTGGTRGIGRAIAEKLRDEGAIVTVTGTSKLGKAPHSCLYESIDFANEKETEKFAKRMSKVGFQILVNNAGINIISPFTQIKSSDFDQIQRVNLKAPFVICRALLPTMIKKRWGRIVNISSVFGLISKEQRASYSSSKFALDGLTAALAAEVATFGVLANCVAPGFIDTDLTRKILGQEGIKKLVSQVPIGRLAKPAEVANLVSWLCGPQNSYLTGQNIAIDGGFSRT